MEVHDRRRQNSIFNKKEQYFYKYLKPKKEDNNDVYPDPIEISEYWKGIWESKKCFNSEAYWLQNIRYDLSVLQPKKAASITVEDVTKATQANEKLESFWAR